jgi:exo-beta-1,3-glucanase (GH17 family)/cellulose synthase/poly-beta-1,6-N-acetylglucosamine synthase-like glycosyltransferase
MRRSTLVILIVAIAANLLLWTLVNKPHWMVDSAYPFHSLSLNPYKKHQSPMDNIHLSPEELELDMKVLQGKTDRVRLYSSLFGIQQLPEIAEQYNIQLIASAYLDSRDPTNRNREEVEAAIQMAAKSRNVKRVILGNETQLYHSVPREELVGFLREARVRLKTPVSTAEPWDYWLLYPEMAAEVDFITIHILPYWAEVPIDQAADYVLDRYVTVQKAFPDKVVMIGETGWPSDGPQRGAAVASLANQATFTRQFVNRAEAKQIKYNLIEAFDQPWKSQLEGRAGEHWGILNADRREKFSLQGPVLPDPNWKFWMLSSTLLGFFTAYLFLARRPHLKIRGQIFSVIVFQLMAALITQLAREASDQYMSPGDIIFWSAMITSQVLLALILITDTAEIADVVGGRPLRKKYFPMDPRDPAQMDLKDPNRNPQPKVSIHLACCKEPPDLMIATLDSLARLDYPDFEVIVVDNNTPDPAMWEPVQRHCEKLNGETSGPRFRFFSLGTWPGFKAGALNFALKQTDPEAKIIAVVDADYLVEPYWLKLTVPYFVDQQVAIVQAPQEHREWERNIFQRMENDEYSGFFRIGMVQRNEFNAIIQHGTMTLIDKATLLRLKGWAEWCICEDTELGLRILNEEKKAIYLDYPMGHGLVPSTYSSYAKQRFRWAYGGMKILKHHWRILWGLRGNLTAAQRYQFLKGWLPWLGDGLHSLFTLTAIVWSILLIMRPKTTDFPEPIFIYPALLLVLIRMAGTFWTYSSRVKIGKQRTLLAMLAGGSLTYKISKAVWQGLLSRRTKPFFRTPKQEGTAPLLQTLGSVWEETVMMILLWGLSVGVLFTFGTKNDPAVVWAVALVVQTFPYLAALFAALVSSYAGRHASSDTQTHPGIPAIP